MDPLSQQPSAPPPPPPFNRFTEASRLYARIHRYQILLRRHWWVLVLSLVIVLTPVSIWTSIAPAAYESKAKMWMAGKLIIPEGRVYSEEVSGVMATQAELIRSRTITDRALAKVRRQHPEWTFLEITNANQPFPIKFEARESPKSAVLDLLSIGSEPESTRAFLNAVLDEYLSFRKEVRSSTSYNTLATVNEQVDQVGRELKQQQEKMHNFQMSNNVVFLQEQGAGAGTYLAKITRSLSSLKMEYQLLQMLTPEQIKELAGRQGGTSSEGPLPGETSAREMMMSMSGPQADYFKATQQIQMLRAKRDELSEFLRDNHPKIIKLDQEIVGMGKLLDLYKQQSTTQLENRRQSLQIEIQGLEAACKEWDAKTTDANRKIVEFERMRQDVLRLQQLYDKLLGVYQTVDMSKSLDQENLSIMEQASPPRSVAGSVKKLALGLVAALFIGFGILYLIELFDDRFASIVELRDQLTEFVVGQVPEIPNTGKNINVEIVQEQDERHVFIESFRNLRSSMLFMFEEAKRPKTILITSAVPEEGKTTVIANLAVTLARGGARVLLIDADLRRDSLYRIFNLPSKPGLAEILKQELNYAQAILPTSVPNLCFIPSGETGQNPGELFLSPSTDVFLREVYPQYDFILLDSAPILATDDSTGLARKVDGVLFVVRGSFTSARMAREALNLLHQRQVNILGLIFNRAIASSADYYYYYEYTKSYGRPKKRLAASASTAMQIVDSPSKEQPVVPEPARKTDKGAPS